MAATERKGDNQKLKMLYLAKLFAEETDDLHALTMQQIIAKLAAYGVNANRKTLYQDIEELRHFGMDILAGQEGRDYYYHLGSRDFELPELKLLVDSVQSAKFITDKKSDELIKKLESLVSVYEGKQLHRQVMIAGRIKSMNESIYYNVDALHEAIGSACQIRFRYYRWNVKKEMEFRRDGAWYQVSPWALMWDNENYYLVAYDAEDDRIKHYRVDKMVNIVATREKRLGEERVRGIDMPRYTRSLFGMFTGEETSVTLEAENSMAGVLIDRFGKDIFLIPVGEDRFRTTVNVAVSRQFMGWILGLGRGIRIVAPESVVEQMRQEARAIFERYTS